MTSASAPAPNSDDVDLAEARRLARSERQRRWLEALCDEENGLRPGDGASGRWAKQTYDRVAAFVWSLRQAGYVVERRPFGPRRIMRFLLTGFSPTYGLAAQLQCAGLSDALDELGAIHPALDGLSEAQLEVVVGLANRESPSVEQLAAAARRLAP